DRTPPQIMNVRAEPTVRAGLKQPVVSFALRHNAATSFSYTVSITAPDESPAWDSGRVRCGTAPQSVYWRPPATGLPGRYRVTIWAWDQAGNPAFASVQQLIV
ncbi:MAG: hypothetical protein ACRDH5_17775, partial [bacterium]